jgi:glycosyltransferase involved in cell wall biosynthesis
VKALHVIPAVAPRYGGPSHAVFEMCRALESAGTQVLIATTDADGPDRIAASHGKEIEFQGQPSIFFRKQWSEAFKYSRPLARWLVGHVKNYDVVHIHAVFSHSCLAAAAAARFKGVPYIVRPLGTLDPWSMRQKPFRKRAMWNLGVGTMLREAAAIHYTATDEKNLAEQSLGLQRGVVIPLGIDQTYFESLEPDKLFRDNHPELNDSPYVLALCRLHPKKGLELLIDTFLDLTKTSTNNNWKLVLAGDGEPSYVASLKVRANQNGGSESIIFAGWLSGDEKRSALQNASLLALPSHQENFGICVVEAMACGVPVLISPHVNLSSDVKRSDSGWIAELDPTEFKKILSEVISSDDERSRRGLAGREFARNEFHWPVLADRINDLYRKVVLSQRLN